MRDIRFRGLSDKGKWHYGFYLTNDFDEPTICSAEGAWKVQGDTIGQFTGLLDKSRKEIYEGDIVKCQQGCEHEMEWDAEIGGTYGGGMPGWHLKGLLKNNGTGYAWTGEEEVIGNIYENPELLN